MNVHKVTKLYTSPALLSTSTPITCGMKTSFQVIWILHNLSIYLHPLTFQTLSSQKVLPSLPNTCTEFSVFPFQPPQLPLCPTEGVLWLCQLTRQSLENGHEHQKRLPFGISFICVKLANGLHEYRNKNGHHANCAYLKTSAKKALRQTKHLFIKIICRNNKKPTRTRSYTVLCDMFFPFPIKSYSTL